MTWAYAESYTSKNFKPYDYSQHKMYTAIVYPSYRVYWESGENEDSRQNVGVVVLTDYFTFYYGYGCPIDYYEENADFYESDLDCVELIDFADMESDMADDAGDDFEEEGGYAVYLDKINELKSAGLADQFTLAYSVCATCSRLSMSS